MGAKTSKQGGGNGSGSGNGGAMASKKLLNANGTTCVEELVAGMVATHPGHLTKLEGFNVLLRADWEAVKKTQVVLISGGGSGHEPAHAGFCGRGMLTAAVCGGVFASPSVDSILSTIRTVTGPKGCLLIVKNYTGDRLNFGMAAEQAKAEGFLVDIVFVGDDAALSGKGVTGRRGLAGTVLVHKVAGAVAAGGLELAPVKWAAQAAADKVRTVGAALSTCNVPGKTISDRLTATDGKMEVGLGIHGEPGRETLDLLSTDELVRKLCGIILDDFGAEKQPKRVAVLVNNLGGSTAIEVYGVCNSVLKHLEQREIKVERIFCGALMTSLEMQGVSLSLLALEDSGNGTLSRLDAPTSALGWAGSFFSFKGDPVAEAVKVASASAVEHTDASKFPQIDAGKAALLEKRLRAGAHALIDGEAKLTEWDKLSGDGDAGETFAKGAKLVLEQLDAKAVTLTSPHLVLAALAEQARKMGGSSGAVLAIFFRACESNAMAGNSMQAVLRAGCDAVTKYGGAEPGMRTMLDSLDAAAKEWTSEAELAELAAKVTSAAKSTADMQASAGRSNYVPEEKLRGVPDPGAMAVAFVVQAIAKEK